MVFTTLFTAWAAQAAPDHALPVAVTQPLLTYFGCLFDPLVEEISKGLPAGRTERERLVTAVLAQCGHLRSTSRNAARLAASSNADRAEIERALLAGESQLRFLVVEREKAIAADDAFCRARGQEPGC